MKIRAIIALVLMLALADAGGALGARQRQRRAQPDDATAALNGVYRIDIPASDKLYTVVAGASSNLPFGEQQRFFIDLAVRLTPPDLLAIERRGRRITVGSSRAPRVTLVADGVMRSERAGGGRPVRSRAALEGDKLVFSARGGRVEDDFTVIFAPVDGGRRLRVVRRISAEQLTEPVVITTFYNKIADAARWDIYGEGLADARGNSEAASGAGRATASGGSTAAGSPGATRAGVEGVEARRERGEADALRESLRDWMEATNARSIERQMSHYMPQLKAFYLARNVPRSFARAEKARAFSTADLIDIRAEEPEIIFLDGGRTAVMRFRKSYRVEDGPRSRRGEVVQELRWQRTRAGWKIFSERDVRVIR